MPRKKPPPKKILAAPQVRVDVRVNGHRRLSRDVYDPKFDITDTSIGFTADLNPTYVDPPEPVVRPPTRFVDQTDVRDQEAIINRIHDGRRDRPVPTTVEEL